MRKLVNIIVFIVLSIYSVNTIAQISQKSLNNQRSSASSQRYFSPFKPRRNKEQEQKLKPNSADLSKYSNFLQQPKTGLIKLYPDLECESAHVLRADEECIASIPGSANYSFREKEYTNDFLADIRFKSRFFVTDGVLTQSFFVNLGDVPIENVSVNSDGMRFLTSFVPESENREALKQYNQLVRGIRNGNYEYRKITVATLNFTYAMRVIAYKANIYSRFRGWTYNILEGDNRIDMIVVFRVIRKDSDGSLSLLWKEIDRKKSVKLKVSKNTDERTK